MSKSLKRRAGFTLIELLIVIAIIAILALIAVPNFLEAQVRAKVARSVADLRTIATGLEAYAVDWGGYPWLRMGYGQTNPNRGGLHNIQGLTTPIGYIGSVSLADPFCNAKSYNEFGLVDIQYHHYTYHYVNIIENRKERRPDDSYAWTAWALLCVGPDQKMGPRPNGNIGFVGDYASYTTARVSNNFSTWNYDASNGTMSGGDVLRFQGNAGY